MIASVLGSDAVIREDVGFDAGRGLGGDEEIDIGAYVEAMRAGGSCVE
jgi:hypothetical protein